MEGMGKKFYLSLAFKLLNNWDWRKYLDLYLQALCDISQNLDFIMCSSFYKHTVTMFRIKFTIQFGLCTAQNSIVLITSVRLSMAQVFYILQSWLFMQKYQFMFPPIIFSYGFQFSKHWFWGNRWTIWLIHLYANNIISYFCYVYFVSRAMCYAYLLSCVWLFATPWTVACQVPLSVEFCKQEYCSGLPLSPPGKLPDSGIKPMSLVSPELADGFFTAAPSGKPLQGILTC